jgi:hypothetical protein
MAWIKRNLLFVVGLAVALALLGVGVFYVLGTVSEADGVSAELDAMNQKLDELVKRDPFPSKDNIEKIQAEQKRVEDFKAKARAKFSVDTKPDGMDNASFKALLEGTIGNLSRDADRSGVTLPEKYDFTFSEQRKQLQLAPDSLSPLATQLRDLNGICQILFTAKIHSLVGLKRTPVGKEGGGFGSASLLSKKITTNPTSGTVSYPYEVSFQCFSTELGAVLTGFINADQTYVIKTLNVERGSSLETTTQSAAALQTGLPAGMDPALRSRYSRYSMPPPVQAQTPPTTRVGEVVLEEKPLKVTLGLEVVKLGASAPPAPKNNSAR